jgi:predicted site-specific integrase-resolvase
MAEACGYRDHSESVNAIDSARKQKPYQKIQGTTDPAAEDLRKQIKNLTEIVTKQENPSASVSASIQSDIDVLRAQVKTLTDLVLSRNDNKKPAPPQFDKKIECFHCKGLGHTRKHCN